MAQPPHVGVEEPDYKILFVSNHARTGVPELTPRETVRAYADVLRRKAQEKRFRVLAFVLMPNHHHLMFLLRSGSDISTVMKHVEGATARAMNLTLGRTGSLWQKGYWDFVVFAPKKLVEKFNYIHGNPVKAKLVRNPEDWFGSSAAFYANRFGYCMIETGKARLVDFTQTVESMAEADCLSLILDG